MYATVVRSLSDSAPLERLLSRAATRRAGRAALPAEEECGRRRSGCSALSAEEMESILRLERFMAGLTEVAAVYDA